jgi:hypothetical protein
LDSKTKLTEIGVVTSNWNTQLTVIRRDSKLLFKGYWHPTVHNSLQNY